MINTSTLCVYRISIRFPILRRMLMHRSVSAYRPIADLDDSRVRVRPTSKMHPNIPECIHTLRRLAFVYSRVPQVPSYVELIQITYENTPINAIIELQPVHKHLDKKC